jgi:hypothetical protein
MKTKQATRGVAKVQSIILDEHHDMQARAYARLRPYLAGALGRLRRAHPAFKTVVFNAKEAKFSLVFGDGTQPREAPKAFAGLSSACVELAKFPEIEWITAGDSLWQVLQGTPQPSYVIEQYCLRDALWHTGQRRQLRAARYYMREDIYSITVYGSHSPGYGKRIVSEDRGTTIDEWIDPIEPMILRVMREAAGPVTLEPMCTKMNAISGWRDGYYIWDVLHVCKRLQHRGILHRINPRAQTGERFVLTKKALP